MQRYRFAPCHPQRETGEHSTVGVELLFVGVAPRGGSLEWLSQGVTKAAASGMIRNLCTRLPLSGLALLSLASHVRSAGRRSPGLALIALRAYN
jgi:hypothetical protein